MKVTLCCLDCCAPVMVEDLNARSLSGVLMQARRQHAAEEHGWSKGSRELLPTMDVILDCFECGEAVTVEDVNVRSLSGVLMQARRQHAAEEHGWLG